MGTLHMCKRKKKLVHSIIGNDPVVHLKVYKPRTRHIVCCGRPRCIACAGRVVRDVTPLGAKCDAASQSVSRMVNVRWPVNGPESIANH